jgi:hypothetical protein
MVQQQREHGTVAEIVLALMSVLGTGVLVWFSMAPQERMWLRLEMARVLHSFSDRAARRTGRRGMGDELAGVDYGRYEIAYRLSRARDRIAEFRA